MIIELLTAVPEVLAMLPLTDVVAVGVVLLAVGFIGALTKEEHI